MPLRDHDQIDELEAMQHENQNLMDKLLKLEDKIKVLQDLNQELEYKRLEARETSPHPLTHLTKNHFQRTCKCLAQLNIEEVEIMDLKKYLMVEYE